MSYKLDRTGTIIGLYKPINLKMYKYLVGRNIDFLQPYTIQNYLNVKLHHDYHTLKLNYKILTHTISYEIIKIVQRKYNPKWEIYFDVYENFPELYFMRPLLLNIAKVKITEDIINKEVVFSRFNSLIGILKLSIRNIIIEEANYNSHGQSIFKNFIPRIKKLKVIKLPTSPMFLGIIYKRNQKIDFNITIKHTISYPIFINTENLIQNKFKIKELITTEINKDIVLYLDKNTGQVYCEINNFDVYNLEFIINLFIYFKKFFYMETRL